jgi:hypothetical protein
MLALASGRTLIRTARRGSGSTTTAPASFGPRKLCRRADHILRELGDNALATPGAPATPMRAAA